MKFYKPAESSQKGMLREAGFTYIEILLAVAIITYVALGFTESMFNNIKSSQMSEYRSLAYNKAVNWIEQNRKDYDGAALGTTTWTTAETGELVSGVGYTLQKNITLSSLGDNGKYKTISVKVDWTERGEDKELEYTTIKAKYD